ncbi:MAG: glycoside hydrolase family 95 protein, partial [Phycisphaeraceae bacterium]|nr:glycoside hydrolase family 95 protein [Phycisphaeraceae bacterium]
MENEMKRYNHLMSALIFLSVLINQHPLRGQAKSDDSLVLWYDQPATSWMTEALPIGNGPMGAMLFGGTEIERIQFNEISLWSGDRMPRPDDIEEEDMGAHQAFGDVFIRLGHDPAKVTDYRRQLDIDRAIHRVAYEYEGVRYQQTAFASHPAHVIVIHLAADQPGAYTGRVWLTDMHGAQIKMAQNRLSSVGKLDNGFEYEAQVQVLNQGGKMTRSAPENSGITPMSPLSPSFTQCDAVTLILGAGTNFEQDYTKQWLGEHPHRTVTEQVDAAAARPVETLRAEHVKDYQSLFGRVSFDLGKTAPELLAKSTMDRLEAYTLDHSADPELEALFCQFGRYLLISCSRPGSLPANLQGVWNHSNRPAWAG